MDYVAVGTMQHIELVKEKLKQELKILEGEGMKVKLVEHQTGKVTFFFCLLTGITRCLYKKEDVPVIFKQYIASALADLILEQWECLLLRQIIRENYSYFPPEEQEVICCLAFQHIDQKKGGDLEANSFFHSRRKSKIFKKLLEFLTSYNQIVIEGFIRFRLKEYLNDLTEAVERAIDNYLLEKEYREFVQLLQYFVEIQKPGLDLIHVVLLPGGIFRLYDEKKQVIESNHIEDLLEDLLGNLTPGEINYADLLFSILVSLAPRQIIFHSPPDGKSGEVPVVLKTMRSVFRDRVKKCPGCALCKRIDGGK